MLRGVRVCGGRCGCVVSDQMPERQTFPGCHTFTRFCYPNSLAEPRVWSDLVNNWPKLGQNSEKRTPLFKKSPKNLAPPPLTTKIGSKSSISAILV